MRKLSKNEKIVAGAVGILALGVLGYYGWTRTGPEPAVVPGNASEAALAAKVNADMLARRKADTVNAQVAKPAVAPAKPVVYASQSAVQAHRIQSAIPGVRLTTTTVTPTEIIITAKRPETARETAAVLTHIVAPTTTPRPTSGGRQRAV